MVPDTEAALADHVAARLTERTRLLRPADLGLAVTEHGLVWDGIGEVPTADIPVRGVHNVTNLALALAAVATYADLTTEQRARALAAVASFAPLAHRLEPVPSDDGRTWVDDGLATAPEAVVAALETYPTARLTLIVGGSDRGLSFAPLTDYLAHRSTDATEATVDVVAVGPAGARLASEVGHSNFEIRLAPDFATALRWIREDQTIRRRPAVPGRTRVRRVHRLRGALGCLPRRRRRRRRTRWHARARELVTTAYSLDGVVVDTVSPALALYPYGVFTTFVAIDATVLGWADHLQRLADGAAELWGHRLDPARVADLVRSHLATHPDSPVSVRVTVFPEEIDRAAPELASGARVLVSSTPCEDPAQLRPDLTVRSASHTRAAAHLKSTDLLTQIRLRREARLAGYGDALLVAGERVLEGTFWSVLVWRDGHLVTPDSDVLPSTTVTQLESVARSLGCEVDRRSVLRAELRDADLVLAANVNSPVLAISSVDDEPLSVDRALLDTIARAYAALPREPV